MGDNAKVINADDSDVMRLLAEISPTPSEIPDAQISDPHQPDSETGVPPSKLHSIPDKGSESKSSSETNSEVIENNPEENQWLISITC